MNLKQILWAVGILVVVGAVFGFWASQTKQPVEPVQAEQHVLTGVATSTGSYQHTEAGEFYTVNALYPSRTQLKDVAADQKARLAIETELKTEIDNFKGDVKDLTATLMPSLADGHKLMFEAEYKAYIGTNTVSYSYIIFEDTGGAHPNTFFKTFVFDQKGNELTIKNVIAGNPNGLQELSLLVSNDVTAQMKKRLDQKDVTSAIFAEGLAPKEENFSNFVIDGDTLVVLIPPYQVAAYVMGSFEVRIKLKDIAS